LETAAELQVKHLAGITKSEETLTHKLQTAHEVHSNLQAEMRMAEEQLAAARRDTVTKESVMLQLTQTIQALEEANKALKEKVARAEDTERQKITDLQLTIGLENEALKAKVPNEQIKGERSEKNQIRLQTSI
jgi:hypothetical protein